RLPIALFGAGMLLLLPLLADALGRPATLVSALLLALSPAFVFYSRYYIQETLLAFFTLGLLSCGWRYAQKPALGWAVGVGICAGLMIASKETALLTFIAVAISLASLTRWPTSPLAPLSQRGTSGVGESEEVALFSPLRLGDGAGARLGRHIALVVV